MYEDDDSVFAAMRIGTRGYLLKGVDQLEMLCAINAVCNGEAIFSPSSAHPLIYYFSTLEKTAPPIFPQLSDRERGILTLIAQGNKTPAIAEKLVLSSKTVRNHVSSVFTKLQVASRVEAFIRARNNESTFLCSVLCFIRLLADDIPTSTAETPPHLPIVQVFHESVMVDRSSLVS